MRDKQAANGSETNNPKELRGLSTVNAEKNKKPESNCLI